MKEETPDLKSYEEKISKEHAEKFGKFFELLTEYNGRYNLTAVTERREVFFKHFLDSAAGEFLFPFGARVAEVGSGAGFPSLPLKILRDDLTFTLIESTGKKCDFLRAAIGELGLAGVTVVNGRAEELARGELRERFDVCCARAVARLNTLAEYCLPLVRMGGQFIAYKGPLKEELKEASRAISVLGGGSVKVFSFTLPETMGERSLAVCRKERPTPEKYPRGRGKERSDPLL